MDANNNWVEDTSQPAVPLFWLNYDECKQLFANYDVFNTFNDANRQTYYDYLENRRFVGRVVKEENVYNREINDYAVGVDALLEGERIRKQIFEYEHDLWNY
jgi:gliding motility associated protien GldN